MIDAGRLRVYVVTPDGGDRSPDDVVAAAIRGGATAIQLRAPSLAPDELIPLGRRIARLCRDAGVLFVVNDAAEVALAVGADGVHVGQDTDAAAVRRTIGPDLALGVSVSDAEQAARASTDGADHLGVTVWSTPTKADARPVGLAGVAAVARSTSLPVVGIGGIHAGNAADVVAAGAAGVAVISAVASADDPEAATRRLVAAVGTVPTEVGR